MSRQGCGGARGLRDGDSAGRGGRIKKDPGSRAAGNRGPEERYFLMASSMALAWAVRAVSGSSLMNFSRFSMALAISPLFR